MYFTSDFLIQYIQLVYIPSMYFVVHETSIPYGMVLFTMGDAKRLCVIGIVFYHMPRGLKIFSTHIGLIDSMNIK